LNIFNHLWYINRSKQIFLNLFYFTEYLIFSDLVNVRQDGAVQEAEKIAVQRASDRQINPHRISAQTMSMPLNINKVMLIFFVRR
jgi:hypothetical protein